jgi:hypothetical protein
VAKLIISPLTAKKFDRPVHNHFIRIHVKRHAGPRLIHIYHKLAIPLSLNHFLSGTLDGFRPVGVDQFQLTVRARGTLLDHAYRTNETWIRPNPTNPIIFNRALCLNSMVSQKRYFGLAK